MSIHDPNELDLNVVHSPQLRAERRSPSSGLVVFVMLAVGTELHLGVGLRRHQTVLKQGCTRSSKRWQRRMPKELVGKAMIHVST